MRSSAASHSSIPKPEPRTRSATRVQTSPKGRITALPAPRSKSAVPRSLQFALFLIGLLWAIAARFAAVHAARGLSQALHAYDWLPLLRETSFVFLLLAGFTTLSWLVTRDGSVRVVNALPRRATAVREWSLGAALGWVLLLGALVPLIASGHLHPEFSWTAHDVYMLLLSVVALAMLSFGVELAFRGFLFQQLIGAIGPAAATVVLSGVFALAASFGCFGPPASARSVQVIFCAGLLYSCAYLRTHAVWLGTGLRFGWSTAMAVAFGLPVSGATDYSSVVFSNASGPHWLSGDGYGPDGATWTAIVQLAGIAALYALTRDYAWSYTHPEIVAGGYPMDVPPPAAHTAMEAAATKPVLVQIAANTSSAASTLPAAAAELRSRESAETSRQEQQ